jgi:hypothetical protein
MFTILTYGGYSAIHKHEIEGLGPFFVIFFSQKHATVITGGVNSNSLSFGIIFHYYS